MVFRVARRIRTRKIRCAQSGPCAKGDAAALQTHRCGMCGMLVDAPYEVEVPAHGCMRAARAMKKSEFGIAFARRRDARSERVATRSSARRGASTGGEVTAVFVCRDATQRSEKKESRKRERERDEEREKQQSKPCRATAVARAVVHNKNRRCFNVTNISRCSFLLVCDGAARLNEDEGRRERTARARENEYLSWLCRSAD